MGFTLALKYALSRPVNETLVGSEIQIFNNDVLTKFGFTDTIQLIGLVCKKSVQILWTDCTDFVARVETGIPLILPETNGKHTFTKPDILFELQER